MINGVIDILINDTVVRDLLGKNKENNKWKVYPVVCPQPEKHPYAVLRMSGKTAEQCKDSKPTDFTYTINVFAYAKTYELVDNIDQAIEDALDKYSGTNDEVVFTEIRFITSRDEAVEVASDMLYLRVITFEADVYKAP